MAKWKSSPETFTRGLYITFIVKEMLAAGVPYDVAGEASHLAKTDDGIYGLMDLWFWEKSAKEKEFLIGDMKVMIGSYRRLEEAKGIGEC